MTTDHAVRLLAACGYALFGHSESHELLLRRGGEFATVCPRRDGTVRCVIVNGRIVDIGAVAS